MKRDDELPIEPLSDSAWKRVERAVFEELDTSAQVKSPWRLPVPRWAAFAIAGVVAVQLGAAALFLLARTDGNKQELASTRFISGNEATETMLGDVAIRLEPSSAVVVVENAARNSLVVLERGAARFSVPPRGDRPAFVVQAGDTRVEVIGTEFRVARTGGSARVDAYSGKVRVSAGGRGRVLTRGETWPAGGTSTDTSTSTSTSTDTSTRTETGTGTGTGTTAKTNTGTSTSPDLNPSLKRRFEEAATFESTDPAKALRIYRGLADDKTAWGANALYAMGRLELELGQRGKAERLLHRYLDRHPNGPNAADAQSLLTRIASGTER